jgi:hypothetical protein
MADPELKSREGECFIVGQLTHVIRLSEAQVPAEQLLRQHQRQPLRRVGEHLAVIGMDVGWDPLRAADRSDGPDVIQMTVGEQRRDRLQPVAREKLLNAALRVLTRVDDHALLALSGRDDVAVGRERPGRKPSD